MKLDGSWYNIEGTANSIQNSSGITTFFNQKESGLIIRPRSPIVFEKDQLYIKLKTAYPDAKLNIKFWSQNDTYQAWYVNLDKDPDTIDDDYVLIINTDPIKKLGPIYIIKIYSDDVLLDHIEFTELKTIEHQPYKNHNLKSAGLIKNGDFEYGMMGWTFWAANGKWRQSKSKEYQCWGKLEFLGYDPSTPKTEAFIASDYLFLDGECIISFNLRGKGKVGWKIAWDDPNGTSKISGGFYGEVDLDGTSEIVSTFKVSGQLKSRLYIMTYSPHTLEVTGVRIWPKGSGDRISTVGRDIYVDGKKEYVVGYYEKEHSPFTNLFKHVQPDGIPSQEYLDRCRDNNVKVWAEVSGAVRAEAELYGIGELWNNHPAVVGVYTDEPDHYETGVSPFFLEVENTQLRYPLWTTVMSWNESAAFQYATATDILGVELYPVINRKDVKWCEKVLERALKINKPIIAVIEASPQLSIEDQKQLFLLPQKMGCAGVFVWNEGIEKDKAKLDAFINLIRSTNV